jgi:hypothetical protein
MDACFGLTHGSRRAGGSVLAGLRPEAKEQVPTASEYLCMRSVGRRVAVAHAVNRAV